MPDESIKSRVGDEYWANSILEMRPMYNFAQKYQPCSQATFSLSHDVIFFMVSPLLGRFLVSFNLPSAICGLQSAVCSLQMSYTGSEFLSPFFMIHFLSPFSHFCLVVRDLCYQGNFTVNYSDIRCIALCVLHILGFSVPSIILADLLGNTCLLARVQKVMVCDSWLVDLDSFCSFHVSRFVALWSSCFGQ